MDDDFAAEIQNIEEEIARNRVEQPPQQFTTTNPHFKPPIGNVFAQAPPQHPVIGEESGMSAFSSNAREYVPPTAEASQHPFGGSSGMQVATRGGQGPLPGAHSFSKDSDERSIFVGNLPKNVPITPEELTAFFGECGPVLNCTILKDRVTHEPKGTAYIEFASYVAMGRALDTMNNAMFKGSAIIVSKKRSNFRPDRARGRGGPRGGMGMQGLPDPYQAIASMMGLMTGASVPSPYRGRGRGGRGGPSRGF